MMTTKQSKINLVAITLVFIVITIGTVNAATVIVDDSGGAAYTTIQQAIDNATAGDTIIVNFGTYTEKIHVNKSLTIISKSGNPGNSIVQAIDSSDSVFHITADEVKINGFHVKDSVERYWEDSVPGIYLDGAHNSVISNNQFSNIYYGIVLESSGNNTLSNNIATYNIGGIHLIDSNNNILDNNTLLNNSENGIFFEHSIYNHLINNTAFNSVDGIRLTKSQNNFLNNNIVSNNSCGIYLETSDENTLDDNIALNNFCGIRLIGSSYCILKNNTASNNNDGIYLQDSCSNNTLINNNASNNHAGISLRVFNKNNTLSYNKANSNNEHGILLFSSNNNILRGNTASNNDIGIFLKYSNRNLLENNTGSNKKYGIYHSDSKYNTLSNNKINGNVFLKLLAFSSLLIVIMFSTSYILWNKIDKKRSILSTSMILLLPLLPTLIGVMHELHLLETIISIHPWNYMLIRILEFGLPAAVIIFYGYTTGDKIFSTLSGVFLIPLFSIYAEVLMEMLNPYFILNLGHWLRWNAIVAIFPFMVLYGLTGYFGARRTKVSLIISICIAIFILVIISGID
ncbi:NosD domain-containing protein [Methanococcoides burtonii]|uniref:Cell surface glycoprotein n=1 Tax=Methanococcoides burtonii (strain DSM 6242 / NBRC 107633 / OCM 468 / ACE-M) TaxID=259564 RepID=Q12Y38_METBU|nr:NosD domain-containing protein [Methanococcoides burtonii]ABE51638.1 Cell surface glycoprotein [Methanococcoides burtonii DSM 6242]